ncbi:DinB family protein [Granulicella paludicola]|uniref:DinB family protein n=1 Tax=Granulicella paludicola TaxID=474951 RepID=UPI0021E094D0|nr:DinB family protein [Granulicella paludicola]
MHLRRTLLVATLSLGTLAASAQMGAPASAAAPSGPVDPVKSLDSAVTSLEKLWTGAASAMPADKYSFAPSAAIFVPAQATKYEGVRTYAQIVTHTIQANYRYFSLVGGIKPDVDVAAIGKLTTKDDILKALADTFTFAHKAVANVTVANAFDAVQGRPGSNQTRVTAFAGAIAHGEDEYGQAVEYLRMNAIIPPASAPREP